MSANGWDCQRKVEEQLRQMREHDIPATVLVLEAWSDETTFTYSTAQNTVKAGREVYAEGFYL